MQNGTISTCAGIFYDSGGEFSNYASSENLVFTICPEQPGQRIKLDFSEFATQINADIMSIYDGNDTSAELINTYSGAQSPGLVFAGFDNASGCLTIQFISDGSGNTTGWAANVTCATPCQEITAVLDSTNPVANEEAIIEVCVGDNISFNGSGVFSEDGTGASYTWDLGDGRNVSGQNINISYNAPGVYLVNLDIRDTNMDNFMDGCPNTNSINQVVRVSGLPDFTGTQAVDSTLCFGDTTIIEGVVTPLTLVYNCPPPESELTALPDGSGAVYQTCINVVCFDDSAVLTDVSQIIDICMNIEHSYSGDLDIKIISPNGQEAIIFDQAGGGIYFGGANNEDNAGPGVGADYCFSMSASVLLEDANTIIAGSNPPSNSWEPGTYLPVGSLNSLVGSPLNGEWCLQIVDNLAIDDGYIFSWELNFDDSLQLEDFVYEPTITSQSWDTDSSITEINGNSITVAPQTAGEHCYIFRTVDEFGCEYTEEVCINVTAEGQPPTTFYEDLDGDGYGDPNSTVTDCTDSPPFGFVLNSLDCNDTNNAVNPDAMDSEGNGVDENCDGVDGDSLSVIDAEINAISVAPNPFKDRFIINVSSQLNGSSVAIKLYDIRGRIIYSKTHEVRENKIWINTLGDLGKAQYFLEMKNDNLNVKTVKMLIKN